MATDAAKGKRRSRALKRIEAAAEKLSVGQPLKLPTHSHYGPDFLLILQLEAIADFLEAIPVRSASYASMSLKALKALAQERGGLMAQLTTKAALIQALEAADAAEKAEA